VFKNQITKLKKFNAETSHMYEALFGENSNDACLAESSPEAKQFPFESTANTSFTPFARSLPAPETLTRFSS
jgi:hypothetical protein